MVPGLISVLVAFLVILVSVIVMAFRERRLGRAIPIDDAAAQASSDARVMAIIFGAIPCGMLLTVLTAWLVFT